jgi:4-amino-4-deoxy-L-arabinose transferase-like glycosyltransferase
MIRTQLEDQLAALALALILAVAFGLRIIDLGSQPIGLPEVAAWRQAGNAFIEAIAQALQGGISPVQVTVLKGVQAVAGDSAFALRLPSVLFSVASVGLAFLLARRVAPASAALLAAILLTLHGSDIAAARQATDTALLGFCTLLFGLYAVGFVSDGSGSERTPNRRQLAWLTMVGTAAGLLLLYSHPAALICWLALLSGPVIIRFSYAGQHPIPIWPLIVSQGVAGIGYLPYALALFLPSDAAATVAQSDLWRHLLAASSGWAGLLVLGTGMVLVIAHSPATRLLHLSPLSDRMVLAAIWTVTLLVLSLGLSGVALPISAREALLTFPAAASVMAGLGYMLIVPHRWYRYGLLAVVTIAMGLALVPFSRPTGPDFRPLAQAIRTELKAGGCVLVGPRAMLAALRYELRDLAPCLKAYTTDAVISTLVGARQRVVVVTDKAVKPSLTPEPGVSWEQRRELARKDATITIYRRKAASPDASPAQ